MILIGVAPEVGEALELLYNNAPMRAQVRNVSPLPDDRMRVGCQWLAEHTSQATAPLQEELRGGLCLISALYDRRDWSGLGRSLRQLRERGSAHGLAAVVEAVDALLAALAGPDATRAYEALLAECIAATMPAG